MSRRRNTKVFEPMTIGNQTFTTKDDAYEHAKELIYRIGKCNSVRTTNEDAYYALCDMLKRHPYAKSILNDIADIRLVANMSNRRALNVRIVRTDGTYETISWNICFSGKPAINTGELLNAMKYSITDQLHEYANNNVCPDCQQTSPHTSVIYLTPYEQIREGFLCSTFRRIPQKANITSESLDGLYAFFEKDSAFEEDWKRYHRERAELSICCNTCNRR